MARTVKRILAWGLLLLLVLFAISVAANWTTIQRVFLGGVKVYETEPPSLPEKLATPAVLVFSKTNGFRHEEAIPEANKLFNNFATQQGWGYFQTENGATFDPAILPRFDAVIFNNVSGDVFTADQRAALRAFIEGGGGFVAIHGAGGDMSYDWDWYVDDVIGAQFIGHTMNPQFPEAMVRVEDRSHPATASLPAEWTRSDEWYSFEKSPRENGVHVLATLDERSYTPEGMFSQDLRMSDHPIIWSRCVGRGRVLYSALGHTAASYREPEYQAILLGATRWALGLDGEGCGPSNNVAANDADNNGERAQ